MIDPPSAILQPRVLDDEEATWYPVLRRFQDASIFQTGPYWTTKNSSAKIEHFVLQRDDEIVSGALVRLFLVPLWNTGIAYVLWGPLGMMGSGAWDLEIWRQSIRALRQEYATRRKMCLRIFPRLPAEGGMAFLSILQEEGFKAVQGFNEKRTIWIDLARPGEDLRKGLDQKWRNCLNRAEKNELEIIIGREDSLFERFGAVYEQMLARKGIRAPADIGQFRAMQRLLPDEFKMRVVLCLEKGVVCAGAVFSAIGERGVYLLGGTGEKGMHNKASYLVQWRILQELQKAGCREYDLQGANPQVDAGVYAFKKGLCGKNGQEIEFLGKFDVCGSARSYFVCLLSHFFNKNRQKILNYYGKVRQRLA